MPVSKHTSAHDPAARYVCDLAVRAWAKHAVEQDEHREIHCQAQRKGDDGDHGPMTDEQHQLGRDSQKDGGGKNKAQLVG